MPPNRVTNCLQCATNDTAIPTGNRYFCTAMSILHLRACAFCLLLLFSCLAANAQSTQIRGTVTDPNGEPLVGATVAIPSLKVGAYTNAQGIFSISNLHSGTYQVVAMYVGYDTLRREVTVNEGKVTTISLGLTEVEVYTDAVEIAAEAAHGKIETKEVNLGATQISSRQINLLPSIGTPDLAQYLQVLPGVVFTGDQGGQLFIRGGSLIQNMTYLDGMIIYAPFHSIGLFSVFDPEYIRSANVYSAGFGAQYGGRISSVIDVRTRNGDFKDFRASVNLNPFSASALLEGPLKRSTRPGAGSSYMLSVRNNYMNRTTPTLYPYIEGGQGVPFSYTDLYGKLTFSDGANYFNTFGFSHNDAINYGFPADYGWNSGGAGANFQVLPTGGAAIVSGSFGYSRYNSSLQSQSETFPRSSSIGGFNGGINVSYILNSVDEIAIGATLLGFKTSLRYTNSLGSIFNSGDSNTELATYFKYKKVIRKGTGDSRKDLAVLEPGLHVHYYNDQGRVTLEPRIRAKLNLTRVSLSAAAGWYSQNLMAATSDRDVVNLFQGFLAAPAQGNIPYTTRKNDNLQTSWHTLLGAEVEVMEHLSTTVEGWYKGFTQLTTINRDKLFPDDPDYTSETGMARGLDFILSYKVPHLYLYLTYGLAQVTRTDSIVRGGVLQARTYAPVWDRRHNVNFVASYKTGSFEAYQEGNRKVAPKFREHRWEFSARWSLGSGFPFTQTQGFFDKLDFDQNGAQSPVQNQNGSLNIQLASELNGGRLPYYHRLDLSMKRKWVIRNRWMIEANASVINAYNRDNIFYIDRVLFTPKYQFPTIPTLGMNIVY